MSGEWTLGEIKHDKCPAASAPHIVVTLRDDTQTFQQVLALQGRGNNIAISWNHGHRNMSLASTGQSKQKEKIYIILEKKSSLKIKKNSQC